MTKNSKKAKGASRQVALATAGREGISMCNFEGFKAQFVVMSMLAAAAKDLEKFFGTYFDLNCSMSTVEKIANALVPGSYVTFKAEEVGESMRYELGLVKPEYAAEMEAKWYNFYVYAINEQGLSKAIPFNVNEWESRCEEGVKAAWAQISAAMESVDDNGVVHYPNGETMPF